MPLAENPYAGQGPVLLDIGGDVGALVVHMPASMEGVEVEIRPHGATATGLQHRHELTGSTLHQHAKSPYPHAAVTGRPEGSGTTYTLVFGQLTEGEYELVPLPDGAVQLTATVNGGSVTHATWPEAKPHEVQHRA